MIYATRRQIKQIERENLKWPEHLVNIPRADWPPDLTGPKRVAVFRSRAFLVQVFYEAPGIERMSVCRTSLDAGRWVDGISWDELQRLKREIGCGALDAVEVYPADKDVVNVANMRHLFIFKEPLPYAWRARVVSGEAKEVLP